jgi:hypothetical protein
VGLPRISEFLDLVAQILNVFVLVEKLLFHNSELRFLGHG